jgi:hypothetical protein
MYARDKRSGGAITCHASFCSHGFANEQWEDDSYYLEENTALFFISQQTLYVFHPTLFHCRVLCAIMCVAALEEPLMFRTPFYDDALNPADLPFFLSL